MQSWLIFKAWPLLGYVAFWFYVMALVVLYGTYTNHADADLWHLFALRDYLCRTGHFPSCDVFSYQAYAQVRPDHEWGSAFIFYPVYFGFGGGGLVALKLVMLGCALALTIRAGLGNRPPTMLQAFFYSLVILALLSSFLSTLRCLVFTHLLLALWVFWFQEERRGRRIPMVGYVLTMIVWANLHGGFVVGLAWLAIIGTWEFFSGRDWKRRATLLGLCLMATLINPFGYELWPSIVRSLSVSQAAFEEWAPVSWIRDYRIFPGYKLLVLWMIPVVYSHIRRHGWKKCDQIAIILLGFFLVPSLAEARQTSLFAVVAGGLLPQLFPPEASLHEIREWKPWLHRFVVRAILVILPLVFAFKLMPANEGFRLTYPPDSYPIQAVDYLRKTGVTGRLLVGFNSGSYALWELRGQMRVSMDGRYELVYPPETFLKVQHFFAGTPDWKKALTDPAPDAVLVDLPDGVYPKMLAETGWMQVYKDQTQAVFLPKRGGE